MKAVIPLLLLLFVSVGISPAGAGERLSDGGWYAIRMQTDPSRPVVGDNTITLTLLDRHTGTGVEGAVIEAVPWMTLHGHGSTKKPRVREMGNGVYTITEVYFTMEGEWDLLLDIRKGGRKDAAVLTFKKVTP
ncbi:MAG: FixH family protein [Alphaproteobacteria bacterium]|uniref:FixH family protein n=1 Tax=Candidatus Nitrobium versatile TaxID=2884831 RepID=A0A953M158_9BACT|nr:FixH family protein [Candidatus Nitrobium versatile]